LMRFAVKVVPLGALGCAAALLVACGDRSGLLSGAQSGSLQDALAAVQSACADGDGGRAAVAAQSFADRVDALPAGTVDRRLVANLQEGASTLEVLVPDTCTATATTTTTPAEPPPTTPPDNGGGTGRPGPGNSGGAPGQSGGAAPGQAKKALKELLREERRDR